MSRVWQSIRRSEIKDDGLKLLDNYLSIRSKLGDLRGVAVALNNLGHYACMDRKDYIQARAYFEESLHIQEKIGDRRACAEVRLNLGSVICLQNLQNEFGVAHKHFEEALNTLSESGDGRGIANCLAGFASLAAREQKCSRAATLWRARDAIYEELGWELTHSEKQAYKDEAAEARQALGEEAFSAAWAQGRTMPLEQAIEYALEYGTTDSFDRIKFTDVKKGVVEVDL